MLSSCGANGTDPAPAPTPTPTQTRAPTPTTAAATPDKLTIIVRDATGAATTWQLTCSPPGGDHPDPATACRVLEQHGATALPAVRKGLRCAQVYGGPETATITGTWRGQPVSSTLSRTDACETGRWNALVGLLPGGGS